ncbi:DUF55-domain-containing protein [Ascodesmis nigricans]|uniref:DUF55-domain-containing protein n=1 Tax=Ascodesmis nigricans TaxID=341454 RepID=A0A4S2MI84_9PEZI|nr:DUF55-domain-containing protein [Ascodesmis nigricans]
MAGRASVTCPACRSSTACNTTPRVHSLSRRQSKFLPLHFPTPIDPPTLPPPVHAALFTTMPPKRRRDDAEEPPKPLRRSARTKLANSESATAAAAVVSKSSGRGRKGAVKQTVAEEKEEEEKKDAGLKKKGKANETKANKAEDETSKKSAKASPTGSKPAPSTPPPKRAGKKAKIATPKTEVPDDRKGGTRFWLLKAEPESRIEKGVDVKFSIDDLAAMKEPAPWDGVRNYAARNNLRAMKKGDLAFFYHSNCKAPGIVGIMEIVQEASVDGLSPSLAPVPFAPSIPFVPFTDTPIETAFDPAAPYYDPASNRSTPKWDLVHVAFRRNLARQIGLQELKQYNDKELSTMPLLKMGRLSVSEVPEECWKFVLELEKRKEA